MSHTRKRIGKQKRGIFVRCLMHQCEISYVQECNKITKCLDDPVQIDYFLVFIPLPVSPDQFQ